MIQIQEPEIEALIQQRLTAGGFGSVEEVLRQALTNAPMPEKSNPYGPLGPTGAQIVEAMRRSPYKDVDIFPKSILCPVSDPVEF